jgi:hypothetical protein
MTLKHAINSTIIMNTIIIDYFVLFNKIILLTKRNKYHNVEFFSTHPTKSKSEYPTNSR